MRREAGLAVALAAAVAMLLLSVPRPALAFCRTMACPLPAGFAPQEGACVPPDFSSWCASQNPPDKAIPVWWRNACVSYDIQQNASRQVPYATADTMFAAAFAKWTSLDCPGAPGPGGSARVSIDVRDLGPVACDEVQYNQSQGNQHVIIFHDDVWPHDDQYNTLGLTTITYDPDTGEIYDADMAINSGPNIPLSLGDPVPSDGYDFQSIITHETGHFLGLAHSGDLSATMFARYNMGQTTMRTLQDDDKFGICSIYLPNGNRAVDRSVEPSGEVVGQACDSTPRHGFQSVCGQPLGCSMAEPGTRGGAGFAALIVMAQAVAAGARRRARPPGM
jgi:hypothetical protein